MDTVEEIKAHLGYGDWRKVASLTGLTRTHVQVIVRRPGSRHFNEVVGVARKIALANKKLGL